MSETPTNCACACECGYGSEPKTAGQLADWISLKAKWQREAGWAENTEMMIGLSLEEWQTLIEAVRKAEQPEEHLR